MESLAAGEDMFLISIKLGILGMSGEKKKKSHAIVESAQAKTN